MVKTDWWRGSVTYQIYPRSFQDSNSDGVGDIKGITQRLDYIADLGVDAIWLSPIFTSPMLDMGYDVSDYLGVDPSFGTLADFDDMVTRAHALGLKVIIDQVISHSSDQHPFFQESKLSRDNARADWYVWADPKPDGTPPSNWQSIFGGAAWEWEPRRKQYYFHNFLKQQPDLNFHNPAVQDYLLETMRFWLERGVDGFRLDTVNFYFHDQLLRDDPADFKPESRTAHSTYGMQYHIFSKNQPENLAFLQRIRALTDEFDARTLVGEVGESHHAIEMMGQYTTDNRLHMAYSFEMLSPKFGAEHFRTLISEFFEGAPDGWPCWAFSNHDVMRHVSRWLDSGADQDALAKQAAALLLSFQGSICLYQGEELGQTDTELSYDELTDPQGMMFWPEDKGRDGCRTPMVWDKNAPNAGFSDANATWLPVKAAQASRAVAVQLADDNSVHAFYKEMLALRRGEVSLREGNTAFLTSDEPILAYQRGDDLVCVFNLSDTAHDFTLPFIVDPVLARGCDIADRTAALAPSGFVIARARGH
jgi:alpha-glucosidase